jgi:hypothetical protein
MSRSAQLVRSWPRDNRRAWTFASPIWEWITARTLVLAGQFCNLQSSSASMLPGVDEFYRDISTIVRVSLSKSSEAN